MSGSNLIVGLGELLWDLLPDGPRLGGAPANFTVMAGRLGDRAVIASRVGQDGLGEEALEVLTQLPVDTSFIQRDGKLPTGTVTVAIREGEPEYTIHEPVAWDRLEITEAWRKLAQRADAVCFGTLAQRQTVSRTAIADFLDATRPECVRVFDVNLRKPFWSDEVLQQTLGRATILKLNAAELAPVLKGTGGCPYPSLAGNDAEILEGTRRIMERYPVQMVCVTLGGRGSLLAARSEWHRHSGVASTVRDTVGAGDAFTAALTHYYLEGAPLSVLNEAGNRWGSWVASQRGAMPELPEATRIRLAAEIQTASR